MSDDLMAAVATLQRKLDEQLLAAASTKKVINMLLETMGKPAQYPDLGESSGIIRPDQFYGKPLATAASDYLELRKQACQPDDILRGLAEGGFDFDVAGWKEGDRLRSLAVSLAKNNAKFHRLKNGSFGLRAWYDDDFLKKSAARKASIAASEDEAEESADTAKGSPPRKLKVGDYVQWESGGILAFVEPKKIVQFTPDGGFAFVEGSNTGIPVRELHLERTPIVGKGSGT